MIIMSRRGALTLASFALVTAAFPARAGSLPLVVVNKDPSCGCCSKWAAHLEDAGFPVHIVPETDLASVKQRLGVPEDLASCHTAEVDGYVIEGHVPAPSILQLLTERPKATGLAVPGMPQGSPGMESDAQPEIYEVTLFGPAVRKSYGRFRGSQPA